MAQQLRSLTMLAEDQSLVPNTHITWHNYQELWEGAHWSRILLAFWNKDSILVLVVSDKAVRLW